MQVQITNSEIDRLGDRLRAGSREESDLNELDSYRRSFGPAYTLVVSEIKAILGLAPTGRPAKSTKSVVDKLKRETSRLSQIQDIAGCRILVEGINSQNLTVNNLEKIFPGKVQVVDRRLTPKHGYRSVHVILRVLGKPIEIQVRSLLQHLWAEFSEKLSDTKGVDIKYGGGPAHVKELLQSISDLINSYEEVELESPALSRLSQVDKDLYAVRLKEQKLKIAVLIAKYKRLAV